MKRSVAGGRIFLFSLLFSVINCVLAQTNTYPPYSGSGNVGIGTLSPQGLLDIYQSSTNKSGIRITGTGYSGGTPSQHGVAMILGYNDAGNRQFWIGATDNVGSSTASLFRYLTGASIASLDAVTGNGITRLPLNIGTTTSDVAVGNGGLSYNAVLPGKLSVYTEASKKGIVIRAAGNQAGNLFEWQNSSGTGLGTINKYGNVLIGKISQTNTVYKLDVAGGIRADSIIINTTGADFVFTEEYNLRRLEEVERFVKENKHLPEIPSAQEMQKEGMSVGEMQTKLLQKVEELTLYVIEQNKRIEKLEKENMNLKK